MGLILAILIDQHQVTSSQYLDIFGNNSSDQHRECWKYFHWNGQNRNSTFIAQSNNSYEALELNN